MKYLTKKDIPSLKRSKHSKKGDHGRVLVIGGSEEYVGAVVLAGLAALRSGVDWVTIMAPRKVGWAVHALSADLVVRKVSGDYFEKKHVKEALGEEKLYDVVVIGNGISLKSSSFVVEYVRKSRKPLVIDADGIKAVRLQDVDNCILTPHKREFELLMKNSKIKSKVELRKKIRNNVIMLKGAVDEIITSSSSYYNKTGNPGMTKAGTGDVLAGLCAGFYAQTKDNVVASKMAAYYNGLIGDILLKKKKGFTYLASDMVEEIKRLT